MKTLITSIFLLLVVNFTASTQNTPEFQPFEKSYYAESLPCATLMPDGSLLYVYTQDTPVRSHHIRVRTPQGETLTKYTFTDAENPSPLQPDTTYQFQKILIDTVSHRYIFIAKVTALEETNAMVLTFDSNVNFIHKSYLDFSKNHSDIRNVFLNADQNIAMLGYWFNTPSVWSDGTGTFVGTYTITGETEHYFEIENRLPVALIQMPNKEYHLVTGRGFEKLDEDLNTISTPISPGGMFGLSISYNSFEKDTFYFTAKSEISHVLQSHRIFWVSKVNQNGDISLVFEDDDINNDINYDIPFYGFDYVTPSHLYISAAVAGCFFYSDCQNEIKLYSVNSNGTLNWTRVLGGDASYEILQTIATPDLGCLLLVRRYDEDGGNWQEEDVYFVKFDKFGNVEPNWLATDVPTLGEGSGLQLLTVALSPNPATDIVQFSYPSFTDATALSFTLYDAVGRQVLHQAQIRTQADLSRLPQGIYYYQIHHQGKPIQAGKLARQ